MTVFDKLCEKSNLLTFLVKLQNSIFYPIIFAIICVCAGVSGKNIYIPCIYILTLITVLTGLFSRDLKPFLVPALLIYYSIGMDVSVDYYSTLSPIPTFDRSVIPHFIICGAAIGAVILYRLIANRYLGEMIFKRGIYFWGIILFDAALLLGGAFSPAFSLRSLLWSAITVITLTLGYMLFTVIISHSNDGIAYACKTLVMMGYTVSAQVLIISYRTYLCGKFFSEGAETLINRNIFSLSWGLATIIGAVLVPPMIACFYLMYKRRFPLLSMFSALFFCGIILLITTRSAILIGTFMLILCMLLCLAKGKNTVINRTSAIIFLIILCVGSIALFFNASENMRHKLLGFIRFDIDFNDLDAFSSKRLTLWRDGLADFNAHPVFGEGFLYGHFSSEEAAKNLYTNMYHNIGIQILASLGIIGAVMFLVHLKHMLEVTVRRFSVDKLILILIPLSIIGMSVFDNFFFYPNFLLIYSAFLACSEICLEKRRKQRLEEVKNIPICKKPRVVFTYVEAGKGHIIPTRNVYECFKRKYGDKVDIIESKFFTETNSRKMEKTEILFRRAVKKQNRSPIISILCKLGNLIAGDTFSLFVLLRMTFSGRKTNPLAVKHIKELDADIIYTAHWSIPFYVNQLKDNRPYTLCFCPDVYSNGAFNVDCNHFLISSDVGYRQVTQRMRMYAGGNISQIPFPTRYDTNKFKNDNKRRECRRKLGIADDDFTVVLSDGGYGLAKLEKTVRLLHKRNRKMTVIALCGMNDELYDSLHSLSDNSQSNVRIIPVSFTDNVLEYIAAADIFVGKSGANSIAEPTALGIPIIITKCITYIERGIKNYYVHKLKCAVYIPNIHRTVKKIESFAQNRSLLEPYKNNLTKRVSYNAEASADIIWEHIQTLQSN